MNNYLEKLDKDIYVFTINIVGFLKTLQKIGIANDATTSLAKLTNTLNKKFNNFYENNDESNEIKKIIVPLIEQIKFILIKNFENNGRDIIHEKANLMFQADDIQKFIEKNFGK
jgi:hypothetical protein